MVSRWKKTLPACQNFVLFRTVENRNYRDGVVPGSSPYGERVRTQYFSVPILDLHMPFTGKVGSDGEITPCPETGRSDFQGNDKPPLILIIPDMSDRWRALCTLDECPQIDFTDIQREAPAFSDRLLVFYPGAECMIRNPQTAASAFTELWRSGTALKKANNDEKNKNGGLFQSRSLSSWDYSSYYQRNRMKVTVLCSTHTRLQISRLHRPSPAGSHGSSADDLSGGGIVRDVA